MTVRVAASSSSFYPPEKSETVQAAILSGDPDAVESVLKELDKHIDPKFVTDNFLKTHLIELMSQKVCTDDCLKIVSASIPLAKRDFCSKALPSQLLSELFEVLTVQQFENVFDFVEHRMADWKSKELYELNRNSLLRLCNDLLKRLSRTTQTVFCGRIFIFLARLLPLNEKSGLNSIGLFNVDNTTKYDIEGAATDGQPSDESQTTVVSQNNDAKETTGMEVEEGEMDDESKDVDSQVMIDYNLYCKLWQLQSCFSSPTTCYDKFGWKKFAHNALEVLSAFSSHKLTEHSSSKDSTLHLMQVDDGVKLGAETKQTRTYFAKYLTSQKLLQLQLNDNNFRRFILTQFLILFQYLTADVRFKDKQMHVLRDDQSKFVRDCVEKCYDLLEQTYPDGRAFSAAIKHILQREEMWNDWKNMQCDNFSKRIEPEKSIGIKRRHKESYSTNPLNMGNPILTKLWTACPNNFEACKSAERQFIPDLEEFLQEPMEQLDPESGIEDAYKLTDDENFQWRALRLNVLKSPQFFTQQAFGQMSKVTWQMAAENLIVDVAKDIPNLNKYALSYLKGQATKSSSTAAAAVAAAAVSSQVAAKKLKTTAAESENPATIADDSKGDNTNKASASQESKVDNSQMQLAEIGHRFYRLVTLAAIN